jgi:hypothetical protein
MIKEKLRELRSRLIAPVLSIQSDSNRHIRRSLLLQGAQAAHMLRSLNHVDCLADTEFRIYSQWGEDGILEWLIQRLPISSNRFIELGVENYAEANTRFLLINRNWKGLIVDSSPQNMGSVRQDEIYWRFDLKAVPAFIHRDNINRLFSDNGFCGKIGVLSIDIDGNDYWVWEAIETVNPDIIVCEYNAVFGDILPISIPYTQDFFRTRVHSSNLYFGASIQALRLLAGRKGYELVGTNRAGCNAFFVRKDLMPAIDSCIASKEPFHSFVRESRDQNGRLTYVSGLERINVIADMPVVRVDTNEQVKVRELQPLYSPKWRGAMAMGA